MDLNKFLQLHFASIFNWITNKRINGLLLEDILDTNVH